MTPASRGSGFTLIELLVVLAVIAIVAGLCLPAVQGARESARGLACKNNLHQIGIGLASYTATHHLYPPGLQGHDKLQSPPYHGYHSFLCRMLPDLGQSQLCNSINFGVSMYPVRSPDGRRLLPDEEAWNAINHTYWTTRLDLFLCPSDPAALSFGPGCSYRGNTGVGPAYRPKAEHPDSGTGLFPETRLVRPAYVVDGLAQTAAVSERTIGSGRGGETHPRQDSFFQQVLAYTADDWLKGCRVSAHPGNRQYPYNGDHWIWTGKHRTLYTHAQPPNGSVPDCLEGGSRVPYAVATARSWHPGGVNLLVADGSVKFATEKTSVTIWRALGTRNGAEIIDGSF